MSVQENDLTIVYSPRCQSLKQRQITKEDVLGIFACVKELFRLGVIHRDLSFNHFMKSVESDEIILVDFGSAILKDPTVSLNLNQSNWEKDAAFCQYQGSIEFAAAEILEHLKGNPYKYEKKTFYIR